MGKGFGSPTICTWQSHAPAGTLKLTGVRFVATFGESLAKVESMGASAPVMAAPIRISRRVGTGSLLWQPWIIQKALSTQQSAFSLYSFITAGAVRSSRY